MIHFVTTRDHAYTIRHLIPRLGRDRCRAWDYEKLFTHKQLPAGTWIFTDHERLSPFELAMAARLAQLLAEGGTRIVNHPAQVAGRLELYRKLKAAGINRFTAWPAEESPRPERFPVFLRNVYDHRVREAALIDSQAALDRTLAQMRRDGVRLAGKLVVEYCGQEVSPGVWQRLQTYRIGDRIIAHTNVVDFAWVVKDVQDTERLNSHPDLDRFIAHEQDFIVNNRHADMLRQAFDLAGIQYGRADFALVDGQPQIYEINTNPNHADHAALFRAIHPRRAAIQKFSEDAVQDALLEIDSGGEGAIRIKDPLLGRQQKRRSFFYRPLWRP